MSFHLPTLLMVSGIVAFTTGLLLAISWLQNQSERCLYFWAMGNIVGSAAPLLFVLRGKIPDLLSIHLANITMILCLGLSWAGIRVFQGRTFGWVALAAGPAAWIVFNLVPAFEASMTARTIIGSTIISTYVLAGVYEHWLGRSERLISYWPTIIVGTIFGIVYAARIPLALVHKIDNQRDFFNSPAVAGTIWIALIFTLAISFLRLALVRERAEAAIRKVASTDQLTRAASRQAFFDDGSASLERCAAQSRECTILLFDLDHFKTINDRWGHAAGDQVLQEFALRTKAALGPRTLFGRLGGEEFVAVLPYIESKDAFFLAENAREAIALKPFRLDDCEVGVTVSIGIAFAHRSGYDLERLLRHADKALYCAKHNGRNRIECADVEERAQPRAAA